MAVPRPKWSFSPFTQEDPPAGYYDPSLDSQLGATQRGLLDTQQDVGTQNLRDTVDYGRGMDAIQRGQSRGQEDLGYQRGQLDTGFQRGTQDLGTSLQRGHENYDSSIAALSRNYGRLATGQRQQQARAGAMRGGAMLQAAAKRAANQQIDRQPLDTNWQRDQQDNSMQVGRLTEDHASGLGQLDLAGRRLTEDSDLQRGQLGLQMAPPDASNPFGGRSFQDRTTALTRAQREAQDFGLDTTSAKAYQATGAGWTPPTQPSNEFIDPVTGQHRQLHFQGKQTVAVDPSGQVLWRRKRKAA